MPSLSEQRVPTRRKALLSWLPTGLIALLCVAVVVGAIAMQNSWWTQADPAASADQKASDGSSMFGSPGVDFFTHEGIVRARVGSDSLPATELGLEPDGEATFEPRVPVTAVVVGEEGAFALDVVDAITVTTREDRIETVRLFQGGAWRTIQAQLRGMAPEWGWTTEQLAQLDADLTVAAAESGATGYSASIPELQHNGALVSAEVTIDTGGAYATVVFSIGRLPNGSGPD